MAARFNHRFVNGMMNIGYLAGFIRKPEPKGFYIQQNNNLEHALFLRCDERRVEEFSPVSTVVHVRGYTDEEGRQQAYAHVIDMERPTVREMPAMSTWMMGRPESDDEFQPFMTDGKMKEYLEERIDQDPNYSKNVSLLMSILEERRGSLDTRLRSNSNTVMLAGLVDAKAFIPPNEHQKKGYGLIMLRQQANASTNIPVRVDNPKAQSILRAVSEGIPVLAMGRLRRKILPDDNGNVRQVDCFVEVNDLYRPTLGKEILEVPEWYEEIRDRLKAKREQNKATPQGAAEDKAPNAEPNAEPAPSITDLASQS